MDLNPIKSKKILYIELYDLYNNLNSFIIMFLILFDFGQLEIEKHLTATKPMQKVKQNIYSKFDIYFYISKLLSISYNIL